jgi:uncharacterized protein YjiS (DUF1127 family)
MAYATEFLSAQGGLFQRVAAIRKAFAEAREQRRVYRTTLNELSSLNNRELADLGISAAEIPFIAREAAYGVK